MSTIETAIEIRPFHVEVPEEELADLRRRIAATRWPTKELVDDRSQGVQLATMQELARYWDDRLRLAQGRGEAERAAAVHDRDRRGRHPLHPRQVAARGRAAADHDARLARLGDRAARDRRPAHRPDRARRPRRGRVRPGAAVPARLRLLGRADRARLERRPRRAGLGGADAPPRLHPLRRPGRRRGRRRHRRDGPPGARGAARHPHELARDGRWPAASAGGVRAGTRGGRRSSPHSGRAASATSWSRPRGRRRSATPCWIHPSPWPPGCSTTTRTATTRSPAPSSTGSPRAISPGPHPRQHHAVLADRHRRLGGPVVLGERTSPGQARAAGQAPPPVSLPVGFTTFPGEIWRAPRSWVEKAYPNLTYFNEVDKGGHFAAWEEPELFSTEMRAAFRPLR